MIRSFLALLALVVFGAASALAADFDHAEHQSYLEDEPCAVCHLPEAQSVLPDTSVCLECHEAEFVGEVSLPGLKTHGARWAFEHRPFAKGSRYDCAACHEQNYCLDCHKSGFADEQGDLGNAMINVHRSDFHVSHPIAARTDPQLCASCHENRFCVECHEEFNPADLALDSHRRGFTDGTLDGRHALFDDQQCQECHTEDSVLPSHDWSRSHAREARKNLATCQACHPEGDVCLKCHSAVSGLMASPHPSDWDDIKGRLKRASDGKTCRKCH